MLRLIAITLLVCSCTDSSQSPSLGNDSSLPCIDTIGIRCDSMIIIDRTGLSSHQDSILMNAIESLQINRRVTNI